MVKIGEKLKAIEEKQLRKDLPELAKLEVGDTVKMMLKVEEGGKVRQHPFEGTVIRLTGRGALATFTIRKISYGEGVEKTFPVNSPTIASLEIISKGVIKRAKLYYLRDRIGKKARVKRKVD